MSDNSASMSMMIELDDVQVRENLTYETLPVRIKDHRIKQLKGKKSLWLRLFGEVLQVKMLLGNWKARCVLTTLRYSSNGKFRGQNFF